MLISVVRGGSLKLLAFLCIQTQTLPLKPSSVWGSTGLATFATRRLWTWRVPLAACARRVGSVLISLGFFLIWKSNPTWPYICLIYRIKVKWYMIFAINIHIYYIDIVFQICRFYRVEYKDRTLCSRKSHQIWILYSSLLRIRFVTLVILWNYILHSCSHSLDPNDPTLFNYSFVNMFPDMAGSYVPAFGRCLLAIKEQAVWTGLGRDAGQYQWASKGDGYKDPYLHMV